MSGMEGHGMDRSGLIYGQVVGFYECGDEPLCSIKYGEFVY